jgi:hypothetical protein
VSAKQPLIQRTWYGTGHRERLNENKTKQKKRGREDSVWWIEDGWKGTGRLIDCGGSTEIMLKL